MSQETAQRIVFLTERRMELVNKETHAKESLEFAARHLREVQVELTRVMEERDALVAGKPIVQEVDELK